MGPPLASVPVVEGEREGEGRSFTQTARHPDAASVQLDELSGERQPEPGALDLLRGGTHLPELLEDRLVILGGDTDARVDDRDLDDGALDGGSYVDLTTLRRELDRVGEQVQEHLLHLALVTLEHADLVIDRPAERDVAPARALPDEDQGVVDDARQIELRELQLHAPRLDL